MPFLSHSAQDTKTFAKQILQANPASKILLLYGDLGSGKTTFVKGFAEALGLKGQKVKSPTFSLREDYGAFIHYDLYRLEDEDVLLEEQMNEDFFEGRWVLIEWPERRKRPWPHEALVFHFKMETLEERSITLPFEEKPLDQPEGE